MKTYTITEDALQAVIDMLYTWNSTCIVHTDTHDIRIESPDGTNHYVDVSDLIGNIANDTAITLETLI